MRVGTALGRKGGRVQGQAGLFHHGGDKLEEGRIKARLLHLMQKGVGGGRGKDHKKGKKSCR